MYLENIFTMTIGFCGGVFLLIAIYMYNFPPRRINPLYGYRTKKSMKNQENWDFAQRYSSLRMLEVGAIFTILAAVAAFAIPSDLSALYLNVLTILTLSGGIIYMFVRTQQAIDKNTKD